MKMKKNDFYIRPAASDDFMVFAEIYRRAWLAAYSGLLPDDAIRQVNSGRENACRQMLSNSFSGWHFLALSGDTSIGILSLCKYRDEDRPAYGEIRAIYLLPEYWHQGYGGYLLAFAVRELFSYGFERIVLWVLLNNIRARRFYEANSFKHDGTTKMVSIGTPQKELRYQYCSSFK